MYVRRTGKGVFFSDDEYPVEKESEQDIVFSDDYTFCRYGKGPG